MLGFLAASLLLTAIAGNYNYDQYRSLVEPALVGPVKDLRTWAFIFYFLGIGLTTRFREFAHLGASDLEFQRRRVDQCYSGIRAVGVCVRGALVKPVAGGMNEQTVFAAVAAPEGHDPR